ncbi:MAG: DUF2721 domain-containing protein [Gemmataceae bacterium]|nr:DUF2721 domain-containing protein [Gemmataceae bacterium]
MVPLAMADFKLTDLLGSAGATIGVIIAGTIFLQFMSSRFMELAGQHRELTKEYRGRKGDEARHGPLNDQIRQYQRRMRLINRAAQLAGLALLLLILAVLCGGASMLWPESQAILWTGAAALPAGLLLIACALVLHLVENAAASAEAGEEAADLDEGAKHGS